MLDFPRTIKITNIKKIIRYLVLSLVLTGALTACDIQSPVVGDASPKEVLIWENDGSYGTISWSGDYNFCYESVACGDEIYAIPDDQWVIIKTGTFYIVVEGEDPLIRVTTGSRSMTWNGCDIQPGDDRLIDNGDGTWTLEIRLEGDPILDVIDVEHLLFTGDRYALKKIFYIDRPAI